MGGWLERASASHPTIYGATCVCGSGSPAARDATLIGWLHGISSGSGYARIMRTHHRCPKCQGAKLYVCENRQPDRQYTTGYIPFCVVAANEPRNARTVVGTYETWICATCGYTEWFAKDVESLERLSAVTGSGVRIVQSDGQTPYR